MHTLEVQTIGLNRIEQKARENLYIQQHILKELWSSAIMPLPQRSVATFQVEIVEPTMLAVYLPNLLRAKPKLSVHRFCM